MGAARFPDAARNRDADCSVRVGMAASGGVLLDAEARRRGETRGEHVRISFSPWNAAQESQNRRARSQRRSYGFRARLTLGWKTDKRSPRRLPQRGLVHRTRRLALHAFPMRRGTAVRNRPDITGRRLFRPGRDCIEWGMLLDAEARRRGETRGEHVRISFSPRSEEHTSEL